MLVSLTHAVPTPMPENPALTLLLAKLPKDSVVARTAGALHTDQPFPGYDEESEAAAVAMGHDVAAQSQD